LRRKVGACVISHASALQVVAGYGSVQRERGQYVQRTHIERAGVECMTAIGQIADIQREDLL
jgi:hypothetical protein